ncbi:endonuclease MutS2 [Alkalibacter rhizosphaerae]|uniref:Endonuclease MutS2 n=1 Tax=Alkalibacter rhizosphaerae TaxID=2815577 RepID=A0A975AHJ3_9FIRM|nr:endonuclease MutS2 [Alkalibacter rhizosphaerae]QSX08674.1 endonuclease MutS2 [Alkalibacter rhizosphaerae]
MNEKTFQVLEYHKILLIWNSFARSGSAKERIENTRPTTDPRKVEQLLQETDEGVVALYKNGNIPMAPFADLRPTLKRAAIRSMLSLKELLSIRDFLKITLDVVHYYQDIQERQTLLPTLSRMFDALDPVSDLRRRIENTVLSEEEISDSASPELFRTRREIHRKNAQIREKLQSMIGLTAYQKHLQDNLITIRQDRFVLPVKQESRSSIPGIVHDQSSSGATLFIEPMAVVEMNNAIRTLRLEEDREIERILQELTEYVGEQKQILEYDYDLLVQLDVIFARSRYALELKANRPKLQEERGIHFYQARHPLIPADEVVASDIHIGGEYSILIVTGPNTGGKTVALKTTGLLCLMAQSGLFLPVKEGSSWSMFQKVYADIGDEQSIEQSLSTFSSHMSNIVRIVEEADQESLVLFDELGAGTDPVEGAALAMSILDHLYHRKVFSMVTTHYSELKQYALSTDGMENASVEFDVATLRPTYRLTIGIPGKSNAFEIAGRLGLRREIIDKAGEYLSEDTIRFEDVLHEIQENQKKARTELEKILRQKDVMERETVKLKQRQEALEDKERQAKEKATMEALQIIEDAKTLAGDIIQEMKQIKSEKTKDAFKDLESKRRALKEWEDVLSEDLGPIKRKTPSKTGRTPKPGDDVLINSMNQKAVMLSKPDKDGNVLVEAGIMKIRIPLSDLSRLEGKKDPMAGGRRTVARKAASIKSSVDVRGMTGEEAMLDVEKYLDDAVLANLKTVTIVHGKGTGVLRKTIHDLLKNHRSVESYRIGAFNEGGDGATIVTLK